MSNISISLVATPVHWPDFGEQMQYVPGPTFCLVTRGTLRDGKPSRAMVWTTFKVPQIKVKHPDNCYHWGTDTDGTNPWIFSAKHWRDNAEHYLKQVRIGLEWHLGGLQRRIKKERLRPPFTTVVQEFDCCSHRKVFYTLPDPLKITAEDANAMFEAIVASL